MTLTRVRLKRFTAFEDLDLEPSPGINAIVGANGTGKTHLMKVCYAACEVSKSGESFTDKLVNVFLPSGRGHWRLVKRQRKGSNATVEVHRAEQCLRTSFSNRAVIARYADTQQNRRWRDSRIESVYIPVKEMLANAPGFRSLYGNFQIHFESVYADILDRAFLPAPRQQSSVFQPLLRKLQEAIGGRVSIENEEFFLSVTKGGSIEFTLLAEGFRKLGLLWLLIRNGALSKGSVLFWDEPEANLNPKLYRLLMHVLLELQRNGVQIFLATHDYVILKELDLQMTNDDKVAFHALHHSEEDGEVVCHTSRDYLGIHPNAIAEAFSDVYDRTVERSLRGLTV